MGRLTLGQDVAAWGLATAIALLTMLSGGSSPSTVLIPGVLIVLIGSYGVSKGARPRFRSSAGLCLAIVTALAAWTLASGSWAWASSWASRGETARVIVLAGALTAGMCWFEHGRARQALITMLACVSGASCVVIALRARMLDNPLPMFAGYRLEWPIDYANAVAALAVTGTILGIAAASMQLDHARRRRIHRARYNPLDGHQTALPTRGGILVGALTGCAAASAGILQLTQSRAAIASLLVGMTLLIVLSPARRQLGAFTLLVAAAQIAISSALAVPFRAIGDLTRASWNADHRGLARFTETAIASVHTAGAYVLAASALTTIIAGSIATWQLRASSESFDRDVPLSHSMTSQQLRNRAAIAMGTLLMLAVVSLATPGHGPIGWTTSMLRGCSTDAQQRDTGGALARSSHFADPDLGRCDFWRVALRDLREAPLTGTGAGNFGDRYERYKSTRQHPEYAHSIVMSLGGELGLVGLALGVTLLACVLAGAWRMISAAPRQCSAEIALLAAGCAWLLHASVDWLWQIPATAVPAMLMAGSLARGTSERGSELPRSMAMLAPAAITAVAILVMLSPAVADRSIDQASNDIRTARATTQPARKRFLARQARNHAGRAARVSDGWSVPLLVSAQADDILRQPQRAARARAQAIRLEPRSREIQRLLKEQPRSTRS